ncbi:MAG: helix-turn-helix domain-containing protein [Thermoplasmataceae archaeon]|jgi:predicted DNA binding protein
MVNIYSISIKQHDCPHTFVTSRIHDLTIFIMNTIDYSKKYQKTLSIFYSKTAEDLKYTIKTLNEYGDLKDLEVLGMGPTTMSLMYSFPKTAAYKWVSKIGFRMHPILVKNGEERWFLVSNESQSVKEIEEELNDSNTSTLRVKKLSTNNFISEYSELFSDVWKVRIDSAVGPEVFNILTQALAQGFYDWPRKSSLSELSRNIKMPRSTLTYRLRKLERLVFRDIGK